MSLELVAEIGNTMDVELGGLVFDKLHGLPLDEVRSQTIFIDGFPATVGDCFRVSGSTSELTCRISGECRRIHGIGATLKNYHLIVDGDVGDRIGSEMRGGSIDVTGNVGRFAGGPGRGIRTGMRGGAITIAGNAGEYCGFRMRRGTIAVAGTAEPGLAAEMVAGTIFVSKPDFKAFALGMRRGTVVVLERLSGFADNTLAKFSAATPVDSVFCGLLSDYLASLSMRSCSGSLVENGLAGRVWQRIIGDRAVDGVGEIWFEGHTT